MCGIVGYIGPQEATPIVLDGLRKLEYRGYDSAGIATLEQGKINISRAEGKLINLEKRLHEKPLAGQTGIGHTRWATHGRPSEINAHPHKAGLSSSIMASLKTILTLKPNCVTKVIISAQRRIQRLLPTW
jgi:glucosamine--fructose-6-phosphate aminotransferase (isomerizing)